MILMENPAYGYAVLAFLLFFCLYYAVVCRVRLLHKAAEYNDIYGKYSELQLKHAVTESKFADVISGAAKAESEKIALQNAVTGLERDLSAEKAAAAAREEAMAEKIRYLEKIKEELTLKFKDISNEIIKAQHESFSAEQKTALSALLSPFAEQLKDFKTEVASAREESIKSKSSLDTQLMNLMALNQNLSKDAQSLTEALKGNKKAQGNWGEFQLDRLLESSGLRKGQDYDTQEAYYDEDKRLYRPDVIIHLPENRDIIVDSKVSLNDYLEAVNADNAETQQKFLQKNLACIKAHIDELSAKEYQKLLKGRTLNYVIMFIPVESAYVAALEADNNLYDYAYRRNVILATPLSLMPVLRTVENLWRIDNQNQNVQKIAELGGKIYDKLAAFVEDMKAIERGLNQASNAYNNAMTKLSGRGSALSQAENMKKLGAKTGKTIALALNDNDLLLTAPAEAVTAANTSAAAAIADTPGTITQTETSATAVPTDTLATNAQTETPAVNAATEPAGEKNV